MRRITCCWAWRKLQNFVDTTHNYWQNPNFQTKAMKKLGLVEKNYRLQLVSKPLID